MGETFMNLNTIKDILFGKPKPFQMTRETIIHDNAELNTLKHISESMNQCPDKAIYDINNASFLNMYIDYIQAFHQYGKGQREASFETPQDMELDAYLYQKLDLKVGIIADTFLYDALKGVCHLTYLNDEFIDDAYDLIIVASTWKGIDGYWDGVTNPNREKFAELQKLIHYYQSKNIPVIFFNKEDPVNFDVFLPHAQLADVIVTTEAALIPTYQKHVNHQRVYHLKFPINLRQHNSVGIESSLNTKEVVFAGSWIEKYTERNQDARVIFNGILKSAYDLTIYDRNLWLNQLKYQFPAEFISNIAAPLSHDYTMMMHKKHPFAINLNTIKYSTTMCANRIFELQGMSNFIFSNYNTFINAEMPQVQIIFDEKDVAATLNLDTALLQRARKIGEHQVVKHYNQFEWLKQIAQWCDLTCKPTQWPQISVIIDAEDKRAHQMFAQQYYPNKVCVHDIDDVKTPFYTYFEGTQDYQPEYLDNLVLPLAFTNTSFITKSSQGNQYVSKYEHKAHTLFKRDTAMHEGYAQDMTFLNQAPKSLTYSEPVLSVIVPIYNNGAHLEHKALRSIIRNPQFHQFEVILVDDGSTDLLTRNTIARYEKWYDNIKVVTLEAASGSASTPRNIGMTHARAPYMTFLDPDNEWVGEGINQLLDAIQADDNLDVVVGNMIKVDNEKTRVHAYYQQFVNTMHQDMTQDTVTLLKQSKLKTASIQALVARTSFIRQHGIQMVAGALGQDSLFFLNVMHFARKVKVVDAIIHTYYAAIAQSMTNSISASFFKKYYKLEIEKIKFLKQHGYLETYMQYRFNFYMKHWYIARINRASYVDKSVVVAFLDIYHLYDSMKRPDDDELKSAIKKLQSEVK